MKIEYYINDAFRLKENGIDFNKLSTDEQGRLSLEYIKGYLETTNKDELKDFCSNSPVLDEIVDNYTRD